MRIVVTLYDITQEISEILASFYGRFHKSFSEINQQTREDEICSIFYKSLNLQNKTSKKL